MKKYYLFILLCILACSSVLYSCLDNNDPETYALGIGMLMKNDRQDYYLELDSGKKLLIKDSTVLTHYHVQAHDRIFTSFFILDEKTTGYEYTIDIYDLYKILVKSITEYSTDANDIIADDKIEVTDIWISKQFLNIEFRIQSSGKIPHTIDLTTSSPETEEGFALLELHHDMKQDTILPQDFHKGIISFELEKYAPETSDLKGLIIRVNTYCEGEKYYKIFFENEVKTSKKKNRNLLSNFMVPTGIQISNN